MQVKDDTPAGAPSPNDFLVPDPSTTFVGEPGNPEDEERLRLLEEMMRAQSGQQVFPSRATTDRSWDPVKGEWVYAQEVRPDPSAVDHRVPSLAPQPTPTFDFPEELTKDDAASGAESSGADENSTSGIRRFWVWLTGG